tara:strand:+ start:9531 stop:10841 length:1311 start_codon:yes stop_codon:yes gene_type:complete
MFYFVFEHFEKPNCDGQFSVNNSELRHGCRDGQFRYCHIDEVDNQDVNYIYPIEIAGGLMHGLQTVKFSDKVLNLYKKGKLKFLINYSHEFKLDSIGKNDTVETIWDTFYKTILKQNIKPSDIIFFLGQTNTLTNYPELKKYGFIFKFNDAVIYSSAEKAFYMEKMFVKNGDISKNDFKGKFKNGLGYKSEFIKLSEIDRKRSKRFMTMNKGVQYDHRITLGSFLEWKNLWDDFYASFLFTDLVKSAFASRLIKTNDKEYDAGILKHSGNFYDKIGTIEIDTQNVECKEHWDGGYEGGRHYKKECFIDSYIHVATETMFLKNELFVTDKVFHAVLQYQPFIVLSCYRFLKHLKTYGFKTFHPFIDESYDEIEDDGERIKAIFEEILKIKEKPLDEIHEWYISIKDILAHNRKLFLSYGDNHWLRCWTKHIVEIYND